MTAETTIRVLPDELGQIVESVFDAMMQLPVVRCGTEWFPDRDRLTSSVHLTGDWNGAVLLECDGRQACSFASRFLSMGPFEQVDDVVRDVLGELANMIGGNVKCVLAVGIRLSMPSVVDGSDYSLRVCGAVVAERLAFQCGEGVFWVTVLVNASIPVPAVFP